VPLADKIVVSPVVPMRFENGLMSYARMVGSAAEEVASVLHRSTIVAALHNIPAATLEDSNRRLDFDVLVACDRREDYERVQVLLRSIEGLRPLYVGPLSMSREIEVITPLLLNAARLNALKRLSVKFVG
jgi:NADPH-dependent F420 reductase